MPPRFLHALFTQFLPVALCLALLLAACSPAPAPIPTPTSAPAATPDPLYASDGGGDPRGTGYWLLWNACAPENRADTARANGGRAAGWFLMDDLLADPGIQLGDYRLESCQQGIALLQGQTPQGEARDEPVYALAAQLLAAELNLGAGAENCFIAQQAVITSHNLLASLGFDGASSYPTLDSQVAVALPELIDTLTRYNRGDLCR